MWQNGFSLDERWQIVTASGANLFNQDWHERGKRRLQRWQESRLFNDPAVFDRYLVTLDMNSSQFCNLLGAPADRLIGDRTARPTWMVVAENPALHRPGDVLETFLATKPELRLIEPFLAKGWQRLNAGIEMQLAAGSILPFDQGSILEILGTEFVRNLKPQVMQLLVHQVNIERHLGSLRGTTSKDRYQSFVNNLMQAGTVARLLTEYPVLSRFAQSLIEDRTDAILEFVLRISRDWSIIRQEFCCADPGHIVELQFGAGEPHGGGRTVAIVIFESGFRLVYKPRNLAAETNFQSMLGWLNERDVEFSFRKLKVLNRKTHGWIEHAFPEPCSNKRELSRYHYRLGGLIALLWALEGIDYHAENLMACGEHPVIVDLESLFHPRAALQQPADTPAMAHIGSNHDIDHSVMRTGLLPGSQFGVGPNGRSLDISGMADVSVQKSPHAYLVPVSEGTDRVQMARRYLPPVHRTNIPFKKGAGHKPADFISDILAGFRTVYRVIAADKKVFLSNDGPVMRCAHDPTRVLMRSTGTYEALLHAARHPRFLRDAVERDLLFEYLWSGFENNPYAPEILAEEKHDLRRGDYPAFFSYPASVDLFSSSGKRMGGYFGKSGLNAVRECIEKMNETDLEYQCNIITEALTAEARGQNTDPTV